MNPYWAKTVDVAARVGRRSLELGRRLVAFLRSVEIDRPLGVILCVLLQVVVLSVLGLEIATPGRRSPAALPPSAGESQSASPQQDIPPSTPADVPLPP